MKWIDTIRRQRFWRYSWPVVLTILIVLALAIVLLSLLALGSDSALLAQATGVTIIVATLIGFFAVLISLREIHRGLRDNSEKMGNVVDMIGRNNTLLSQINQAAKLSDAAKEIAFRDTERMELAEAVIAKLHQHEFDITFAMIDTMTRHEEYQTLAAQLRRTAERYKNATEKERINQAINHVLSLGREHRWSQAYRQADNLIRSYPYSEEAKGVRRKLRQMKDGRKRELLALWDQAVQTKDTDRSLEILKELDTYLTPSEGLALQESASTIFRTRLHNLGVRFALAVTENQWSGALLTGQEIVREFPNSRMAHEIRGKLDVLQERARMEQKHREETPTAQPSEKAS